MTALPSLSNATLARLPAQVRRPGYDRAATRIGIVHLGAGAFHRAHQAVYIDELLAEAPDWAICAVSLHSRGVRDALRPQDGLYTLALLDAQPAFRVIGAITEVLCAADDATALLARLADPGVRLVTLSITEKGYCLAGDTLDLAHPDIVHDLAEPDAPRSAIGWLCAGLRARHAAGLRPYSVLSCDNLADNGGKLRRAVLAFTQQRDPALAAWIAAHGAFPRSMVDSITPASDDALRARVAQALQHQDAWPVQREAYAQWVIEDRFCDGRPPLQRAGVVFSDDVAGYEHAKLRLLNGAHSSLAYLGLLLGLDSVGAAMRQPALAGFVEALMREDIAPGLPALAGFDAQAYAGTILQRFANPAVQHRLAQIAWDGSQKLPVRLLAAIAESLAGGRDVARPCLAVAAWLQFLRRQAGAGSTVVDPLADTLATLGQRCTGEAAHDIALWLTLAPVFGALAHDARFIEAMQAAYAALGNAEAADVQRALLR